LAVRAWHTADLPTDEQLRFPATYAKEFTDQLGIAIGARCLTPGSALMLMDWSVSVVIDLTIMVLG